MDQNKFYLWNCSEIRAKDHCNCERKLSLGARVLQVGGVEKIFKQLFSVREGAKLLKASQCYISTTSGPIAGLLFISTNKVAFCSERSIKISSPKGEFVRAHYKVQSHMNDDRYYISLPMIANILIATYLCRSWSLLRR